MTTLLSHATDGWVGHATAVRRWGGVAPSELDACSDADLVASGASDRERAALVVGVLYRRHQDAVRRVCGRRLQRRDSAAIDDAVQETFARLHRAVGAGTMRTTDSVLPWLRRTAGRICLDHLDRAAVRHEQADPALSTSGGARAAPHADDHAEDVVIALLVSEVLEGLPARQATLLREFYLDDRSLAFIAASHDSTTSRVKNQLWLARRAAGEVVRRRRHPELRCPTSEFIPARTSSGAAVGVAEQVQVGAGVTAGGDQGSG